MMFVTAKGFENDTRENLLSMDTEMVFQNREAFAARLRVLGTYDLARDLSACKESREIAALFPRLHAAFGMALSGGIVIEDLNVDIIEFECLYGLTDPVTNMPGREITFTVRDKDNRFPIYLTSRDICLFFNLSVRDEDVSCVVKSCVHREMSTKVTLVAQISSDAFSSEGEFIMSIEVKLSGKTAASHNLRFVARNTISALFQDDFSKASLTGRNETARTHPSRQERTASGTKTIVQSKNTIQTRQKNVRLIFDKHRGSNVPKVVCSNSAFKASMATRTNVMISFKLQTYKALERKLMSGGLAGYLLPETSVWVEWDDTVHIYSIQYKGFLMEPRG